jgi:hypothetical protein
MHQGSYHQKFRIAVFITFASVLFIQSLCVAEPINVNTAQDAKSLTKESLNQTLTVRGMITAVQDPISDKHPLLLTITPSDSPTKVLVGYLPERFVEYHNGLGIPKVGLQIAVRGRVWDFEGNLLLKPEKLEDILIEGYPHTYANAVPAANSTSPTQTIPVSAPTAPTQPASKTNGALTINDEPNFRAYLNQEIEYTGTVQKFKPYWSPKAPNIIYVGDEQKTLEVIYWDTEDQLNPLLKTTGQKIRAKGTLQDHRGILQLRVAVMEDIQLQNPE